MLASRWFHFGGKIDNGTCGSFIQMFKIFHVFQIWIKATVKYRNRAAEFSIEVLWRCVSLSRHLSMHASVVHCKGQRYPLVRAGDTRWLQRLDTMTIQINEFPPLSNVFCASKFFVPYNYLRLWYYYTCSYPIIIWLNISLVKAFPMCT